MVSTWRRNAGAHAGSALRNNIIANDTSTVVYLLNAKSTTGVALDHNLWYAPAVAAPINWGGGTAYAHAAWVSASGQGAGDLTAEPAFAGLWGLPAAGFQLAAGSPAINAGVALDGLDHDFLLAARPAGGGFDLGAFEYGATPSPDGGPHWPDAGTAHPDGGRAAGDAPAVERALATGCACRANGTDAAAAPLLVLLAGLARRRRRSLPGQRR